jgi:hypothetical protein
MAGNIGIEPALLTMARYVLANELGGNISDEYGQGDAG